MKNYHVISALLGTALLMWVLANPDQDPSAPYRIRKILVENSDPRYCSDMNTWVVEVKNSAEDRELFYKKIQSSEDTILWVEQVLFFAREHGIEMSHIVLGYEVDARDMFFSFCANSKIREEEIVKIIYQSGL